MPKERIYGEPSDDSMIDCDVSIQWEKAEPHHDSDGDGYSGYVSLAVVNRQHDEPVLVAYLSRTALNRLIWAARKARDGAYGSDA